MTDTFTNMKFDNGSTAEDIINSLSIHGIPSEFFLRQLAEHDTAATSDYHEDCDSRVGLIYRDIHRRYALMNIVLAVDFINREYGEIDMTGYKFEFDDHKGKFSTLKRIGNLILNVCNEKFLDKIDGTRDIDDEAYERCITVYVLQIVDRLIHRIYPELTDWKEPLENMIK